LRNYGHSSVPFAY